MFGNGCIMERLSLAGRKCGGYSFDQFLTRNADYFFGAVFLVVVGWKVGNYKTKWHFSKASGGVVE